MKHKFLRRLSALALALVMAASLCTPAWADGPTELTFSSRVIFLKDTGREYTLEITGASVGETITFAPPDKVTLASEDMTNNSITVVEDPNSATGAPKPVTVKVTASGEVNRGELKVTRAGSDGTIIGTATCYVYCIASPVQAPEKFGPVTEGQTPLPTLTATVTDPVIADLLADGDITFGSGNVNNATVATSRPSKDRFVATIDPLKALTAETVTITMYLQGVAVQSWDLTINPKPGTIPVETVTFNNVPSTIRLLVGESYAMPKPVISPSNATDKGITWTSSPAGIVEVDENGKITAKAVGTAKVTATANVGTTNAKAEFTVRVTDAPFSAKLEPSRPVIDLRDGGSDKATLILTASGLNSDKMTVTRWTSGNQRVAVLDDPNTKATTAGITAKGGGTATFTAYISYPDANNKTVNTTVTCTVSVLDEKSVEITRVDLSETSHTMPADGTFKLTATVTPSNALVKTVEWTSTNPAVAEVKDGVVTAKSAGETVIIAKAVYGNLSNSCTVKVTPAAETIILSGFNYDSNTTGTNKYTYTFRGTGNNYFSVRAILGPTGAGDPIHWVSKNPAVATVSSGTGIQATVTAVAPGRATITAVPMDPNGKDRTLESGPAEITVTVSGVTIVNDAASPITSLTLMQGQHRQIEGQVLGSANNGDPTLDWISSDPSVVSVSSKNGVTTTLTARAPGTALITATKGTYSATCSITVTEDTAGVINGGSTPPGVALEFSKLVSSLQSACSSKTGAGLSYITNLSVASTDQGILHDKHFSSDDTGAGVGIQDRYYPGTAPQGQRSLNDLSFVPRTTFSGTAEINYTAWSTNNQSVNGVIKITVNGTGDVMYSANAGSAISFLASDFSRIHSNLRSVSFTPPLESMGILYYKYTTPNQPGTRVTASDVYNRTGTPNLDDVSFVPAAGYRGAVRISYKGTDTSGKSLSGVVTINVTDGSGSGATPADISYSVREDSWVTFRPSDFNTASRYALGESLSYVRFTQPPSGEGTLFYNYQGFSNFDGTVSSTTNYYYSGTPALGGVSFVPTTTTPSRVDVPYTGYTTRGNTFTGTVHISLGSTSTIPTEQDRLRYTVFTGRSVNFNPSDFNAACLAALGRNLVSIQFNSLPGTSQGNLRVTRGNSSTPNNVTTGTRFLCTGSSTSNLIENVYFQASSSYTGTFTISFTGTSENGATFTDKVTIVVTPPVSSEITYSGTTANPIRLSSSRIVSAASSAPNGTLSYITFNNLPSATAGKLLLNYSGLGTGTQVSTGTRYYVSGTPGIDQISFVPRGRCTGQVGVGYTAVSTNGQSVSGRIMFNITSSGNSGFFNDMYYYTWAAPSVDYLYQNGVVKGTSTTTFGPSRNIKRCDFVLMLCRAFRFSGTNGYSFADVPINSYYSQAVATAKQLGIISGDGAYFNPNSVLTRQDAMVMIYNALNAAGWNVAPAPTSVLNQFTDSGSVSGYARNAVSALVQMGAVNGSTSGRLNPRSPITRAEAAVILHFVLTM